MSKPVMIGVSGIRGIVGEGLTPQLVTRMAAAAGTWYGRGDVIVGGDSRVTGEMVRSAVFAGLLSVGCNPVDIGICATPTVQMAVQDSDAVGGIAVTASHNPVEWNALKLLNSRGLFLDADEGQKVAAIAQKEDFAFVPWTGIGHMKRDEHATARHIRAVMGMDVIDPQAIRKRKFRVALDCVNGAGGVILLPLLEELECEIFPLHAEPTGVFAHTPEPLPENLGSLCRYVQKNKADVGFAVDPDVDRLAMIDENGNPLGEEYTVTLAVQFMLKKRHGSVVVNLSTTRAVEDVARSMGAECLRTPVGEIHVVKKMLETGALIGGEGNGGVIFPEVHPGRDAPVAIALILQALLESRASVSALRKGVPDYCITKKKVEIGANDPEALIEKMKKACRNEKCTLEDGLKIDFKEGWVHIRKSNTEPILRIIAESRTAPESQALAGRFAEELCSIMK